MASVVDTPVDHASGSGSARRRRERRLRAYLRYARMSVAMALAEVNHHSAPRRPKTARARGWTRPEQIVDVPVPDVLVPRRLPPPQEVPATLVPLLAQQETSIDGKTLHFLIWRTFMDRKALEEQERKEQEVVEWTEPHYFSVATPRAPALDVPVLADDDGFFGVVLRLPSRLSMCPSLPFLFVLFSARLCLSRSWWNSWWEVPTVLSYSLLQQRTAEQIIDFPVPGRGGGARGGLQGLPQGQGSTASAGEQTIVPARGGLQGLPQGQVSTASAGEQTIVPSRGGLHGFSPGQGSTSVSSAERFSERIVEQIVELPRGGFSRFLSQTWFHVVFVRRTHF